MVVHAAAEERRHGVHGTVRREDRGDARDDLLLGQALGEIQPVEPHGRGDVGEEVIDAPQPQGAEHLVRVRVHAGAFRGTPLISLWGLRDRTPVPREVFQEKKAGAG